MLLSNVEIKYHARCNASWLTLAVLQGYKLQDMLPSQVLCSVLLGASSDSSVSCVVMHS